MTVLSVDLGGTRMRAALVEPDGVVRERVVLPTPRDRPCADALVDMVRGLPDRRSAATAVIGVPGRVHYLDGRLEHAPNLPPGWVTALTEQALGQALELPVSLANDADLAAVGEHRCGAGRGADDVVYLTLSTGVGAGVLLGGRLVAGRRSGAEVGHVILDLSSPHGTVEGLASGTAVARDAASAGLPGDAAALLSRVDTDPVAAGVWQRALAAAGACAVGLAHLYCPQRVVVGGGLGLHAPGLTTALAAAIEQDGPRNLPEPVEVVLAQLGDDAGLVGAAGWRDAVQRPGPSAH